MKSLKVVFFGTPDFAKHSLQSIHQSHHEVVGVVTVADKASGRGQKIHQSPVKKYALEHAIPVFQPEKLRNESFLDQMKALEADIFVVVAFRMMPSVLFEIPPMGTFNLHGSLLPDYRGAAPINYAIINGEKESGVTTFFINEKIDEGNLLLQAKTPIGEQETAGELHDKLMEIGGDLVVKTLDQLSESTITERPQPTVERPKNAFKIFKEDTKINWENDGQTIHNFIRGMSPYPCAFTSLKIGDSEKTLKIFNGQFLKEEHHKAIKTIEMDKKTCKIYVKDGIYLPNEVQLQGKKRMKIQDFLNGIKETEQIALV